jgi:hypothetical protein
MRRIQPGDSSLRKKVFIVKRRNSLCYLLFESCALRHPDFACQQCGWEVPVEPPSVGTCPARPSCSPSTPPYVWLGPSYLAPYANMADFCAVEANCGDAKSVESITKESESLRSRTAFFRSVLSGRDNPRHPVRHHAQHFVRNGSETLGNLPETD